MKPDVSIVRHMFVMRDDGVLIWTNPPGNHAGLRGRLAGSAIPTHNGKWYWSVQIGGRKYKRSHLVFLLEHGRWPANQIDHRDGNSLNDRPDNLREATVTQNAWNHKGRAKKSDTPMGVRRLPSGRYIARISVNKRQIALGVFDHEQQARAAYQSARVHHFGEFA